MKKINLALVGATGLVGSHILESLTMCKDKIHHFLPLASAKSKGKEITLFDQSYQVEELTESIFFERNIDVAMFAAGGKISKQLIPNLSKKGIICIDNSSVFRMQENVPLVVPEVNPESLFSHQNIIANPNCSTIQAVVVLHPLHQAFSIRRVVISTYQSVSGAGSKGIESLEKEMHQKGRGSFQYPIFSNCIPHIDEFSDDAYTKEEWKMINESKKILLDVNIRITATSVRVPIFVSHCESVNIELEKAFTMDDIVQTLKKQASLILLDDPSNHLYPTPEFCRGKDEVFVGRIRKDNSHENAINLWICADNLRKGAATNAVQILKLLLEK